MSSMLKEKYEIHSEKYHVDGVILDYGMVIKLQFEYDGRQVEMGLSRPLQTEKLLSRGIGCMEFYIEHLSQEAKERPTKLYNWYVDPTEKEESIFLRAHGNATGHSHFTDSARIHTSGILYLTVEEESGEVLIQTHNTTYHCPLSFCRFYKQDAWPDLIPNYEALKEKYQNTKPAPTIEPGKVLLVLSNFSDYYFYNLYYQPNGAEPPLNSIGMAHVGNYQDSYLIETENHEVDLRYFPHFQSIEFYSEITDEKPFFIENIGDTVLFADTSQGVIKLGPGERKEVCKENAEEKKPVLPTGDLYPAQIIE